MKKCLIISGAEQIANYLIPKLTQSSMWSPTVLYNQKYPLKVPIKESYSYNTDSFNITLKNNYDCLICCANTKEQGSIKDMNFPEKDLQMYQKNLFPVMLGYHCWEKYGSNDGLVFLNGDYETFVGVKPAYALYTYNKMMAYKAFQSCTKGTVSYVLSHQDVPEEAISDVLYEWINSKYKRANQKFISIQWKHDSATYDYIKA